MRMEALRSFRVGSTKKFVAPGDQFEVADRYGSDYERRGMAVSLDRKAKAAPAVTNQAAGAGPLSSAGGRTGEAAQRSSSPAGRAPRTPRQRSSGARKRAAKRKS